jgi:hypothetical protein
MCRTHSLPPLSSTAQKKTPTPQLATIWCCHLSSNAQLSSSNSIIKHDYLLRHYFNTLITHFCTLEK